MEYFGQRYADYVPVLPSDIIAALSSPAIERVVPSQGLAVNQISFALKQFGFGPRIYSREAFAGKEQDFRRILAWYVESGIPAIVALENAVCGHAVVFVGHETIPGVFETYLATQSPFPEDAIPDAGDLNKRYIVIDDNFPPYQSCTFDSPTAYYSDPALQDFKITAFVVPLYPRIYLEPLEAYQLAMGVLKNAMPATGGNQQSITRFFLTSSRSYKNWVHRTTDLQSDLQEIILATAMPKFIWILEMSNYELFQRARAMGMMLIDATGDASHGSLLFFAHLGKIFLRLNNVYEELNSGFTDFPCYENNLKGEWSQWRA